ncbi:MAG: hypothetical protein R6W90_03460 [Ignavibacteriaceae bacterium]
MKKILFFMLIAFITAGYPQIKSKGFDAPQVSDGIISRNFNPLFGFLNSENFSMDHSFSMSYSASGREGLALGVYTNSMMYRFTNNLNVQVDASFVNSPYSTLGDDFQKSINGVYISKAAVNYKPWDDVFITLQYRNMPSYTYDPYSYYGRYGYGNSFFDRNNGFFFDR